MPTAIDSAPMEDNQVEDWRREVWVRLGYGVDWADFLSRTMMDSHRAEKMQLRGATRNQIVRALAGYGPLGEDPSFDWDTFSMMIELDNLN